MLSTILNQNTSQLSYNDQAYWISRIIRWVQRERQSTEKQIKIEVLYSTRLKFILNLLEKNPEWKNNFVKTVSSVLTKMSSFAEYSHIHSISDSGIFSDFYNRVQEKFLPRKPLADSLTSFIHEVFPSEDESVLIDHIDPQIMRSLLDLFNEEKDLIYKIQSDLLSACYVLSVKLLDLVFSIQRETQKFGTLPEDLAEFELVEHLKLYQKNKNFNLAVDLGPIIENIEQRMQKLEDKVTQEAVRIELLYFFKLHKKKIKRLRILLNFFNSNVDNGLNARYFLSDSVIDLCQQKSLLPFLKENFSLLLNKIIQANSHVGEHYVTRNWREFRQMFKSAMGGGAVTAITVFIKLALGKVGLTGFVKGFANSMNYSASFLLIQFLGFTLGTKQPSATAPFIAHSLLKSVLDAKRSIIAVLRTQFIAVLGNLVLVFPICFLVSWLLVLVGHPYIDSDEAHYVVHSTNLAGPSFIYAIYTGVLLFLSSLFAGWFENWTEITQLDRRVRNSQKIAKLFGRKFTEKIAYLIKTKSNPLAANTTLGFLLGMTPQVLTFFNVPMEVRHVTLSTGAFAAALPVVMNEGLSWWKWLDSFVGILIIGLINIFVSFSLALAVAALSTNIDLKKIFYIFQQGLKTVLMKPWLLIIPEKRNDTVKGLALEHDKAH